jgi:acetylornithine deacetylase/succinyl-diaminopimelate desuccinylase-like protein
MASGQDSQELVRDIRERVAADIPWIRSQLERLIRIPSVSADGFDPAHVRSSANATAEILSEAGLGDVRLLEIDGAHPAVFGELPGPPGSPTVLLYAHHDVQPPGDESLWISPPFEPTERGGRLYGRGASDDKGGIAVHAAAIRAHEGSPPVGVKVVVEGEEEASSEHLPEFLTAYGRDLAADVLVLADSSNWRIGVPALTTSIRGVLDCVVEVRTLDHAVHSGVFGGATPDALMALSRLLATLHDDRGAVAIPGLEGSVPAEVDLPEETYRADAGVLEGVQLVGEGSITERLWARPAVSILGIDAPTVHDASNQLVAMARAKVSLRVPPGVQAQKARDALVAHLESNAPWGARVAVTPGSMGEPFIVDADGPLFDAVRRAFRDAWDHDPVDIGMGGSIPLVKAFADAYPEATILLTGIEDPDGRAHGENESLHLGEFERACVAEALLLSYAAG